MSGSDEPSQSSSFQKTLKASIRNSVEATNRTLASLEEKSREVSQPVVKGLKTVEEEGSYVATKAIHAYERRHEFGPHIVVGTAFLAGSVVALRRGRIAGVFSSILGGGAAYLAIYPPISLEELPDVIFGKKDG